MFKSTLMVFGLVSMLSGCDVRKKDQQSTMPDVLKQEVLKDPSTVQLIDSVYDFGKVTDGEVVEFNYRFKNTSNNPLIVSNVSASCGCTIPEKPEAPIMPGEIGFIKVKFNSQGRVGQAHKTVNVLSNANPGFPALQLTGEVLPKTKE
ncbi:MAG: DUF1573 domain-containing protein [Ferruginibacter sp.]